MRDDEVDVVTGLQGGSSAKKNKTGILRSDDIKLFRKRFWQANIHGRVGGCLAYIIYL